MPSWLYVVPIGALCLMLILAFLLQNAFARSAEACGNRLREQYHLNAKQFDVRVGEAPPAWAAAQTYLHMYIANNVFQVKMIFWASMFVMMVGFFITCFGVVQNVTSPPGTNPALERSFPIIAGVLTQFIAATFLFIFRSTSQSAAMFIHTLDRMNTVGMAMCILRSIPENITIELLRANAYADLAKDVVTAVHGGLATRPAFPQAARYDRLAAADETASGLS